MKALIVLVVAVLVLAAVGWISFTNSPDKASVNVEKTTIQQDTERAIESGQQLVDEAGQTMDRAVTSEEELPPAAEEENVPETAAQPALEPSANR